MDPAQPVPTEPVEHTDLLEKLLPTGAILHTHLALSRLFEIDAAEKTTHDTTTLDLLLRIRLAPQGRIRAVDLCDQMQKSASHVARVVERAEFGGLIERRTDPTDRRAQQIALTVRGKRDLDSYIPHVVKLLDRVIYATLSSAEIETLVKLLNKVATASKRLIAEHEGR